MALINSLARPYPTCYSTCRSVYSLPRSYRAVSQGRPASLSWPESERSWWLRDRIGVAKQLVADTRQFLFSPLKERLNWQSLRTRVVSARRERKITLRQNNTSSTCPRVLPRWRIYLSVCTCARRAPRTLYWPYTPFSALRQMPDRCAWAPSWKSGLYIFFLVQFILSAE